MLSLINTIFTKTNTFSTEIIIIVIKSEICLERKKRIECIMMKWSHENMVNSKLILKFLLN